MLGDLKTEFHVIVASMSLGLWLPTRHCVLTTHGQSALWACGAVVIIVLKFEFVSASLCSQSILVIYLYNYGV